MTQNKWTQVDCEQLLIAVSNSKINKRINWVKVASHLPGRTPVQCKSQYTAKLHYKSVDKVNMVWDYDANLLLNANVDIYGQNWKFLSESIYSNKVSPEAIRKQYVLVSERININCESYANVLVEHGINYIDEKSLTFYVFCLGLRYRLEENRLRLLMNYTEKQVRLPLIYDKMPCSRDEIYAETADQLIYQPYYRKLESALQIHKVIAIIEKLLEQTNPLIIDFLCAQFDLKRKSVHKLFL
ncbi:Myb-like_DNA-binding domain-containing protein [Hexamita inflata]|uniref:Myb-like DNA-binding domain-containing protein n=1 Tax=Hexamita inflata TaxID=28002 RepID=A0AA86PNM5_9EUKA|nr:Myb-like DNA-binding domain-containing protein [Hexamita inflata]CAI9940543.1 Myb-like DNA-binding domain-containing protein [Hexamita inflata]CAI9940548.1 Myb-like DNA-binding domain-containing protein [Hexamita inflata]